jgi:hypothetical protein
MIIIFSLSIGASIFYLYQVLGWEIDAFPVILSFSFEEFSVLRTAAHTMTQWSLGCPRLGDEIC